VKDPKLYLLHIAESISRIEGYTLHGREEFLGSTLIQDAVIRNFEIIGEAVKQIPDELRKSQPAVPWSQIAAFRNLLIHNYMGVKLERVWEVIAADIPALKAAVEELLATED
jgi:uncharacterized protein with HEPN domain